MNKERDGSSGCRGFWLRSLSSENRLLFKKPTLFVLLLLDLRIGGSVHKNRFNIFDNGPVPAGFLIGGLPLRVSYECVPAFFGCLPAFVGDYVNKGVVL